MYQISEDRIRVRPEIRLGDKIYSVDNRLSTYRRISAGLEGQGVDELEVVLGEALGRQAYEEILGMDLSFAVMQEMVVIVLAAIQDLPLEEARRRFRGNGSGK